MKTITRSIRLKNKGDKTVYTVQITGEQITLMRSLYLRIEQTWLHQGVGVNVCRDGTVERIPMWECHYCGRGSFDGPATIQHKENCIIPLADAEWEAMNAQFIKVLNGGKDEDHTSTTAQ